MKKVKLSLPSEAMQVALIPSIIASLNLGLLLPQLSGEPQLSGAGFGKPPVFTLWLLVYLNFVKVNLKTKGRS